MTNIATLYYTRTHAPGVKTFTILLEHYLLFSSPEPKAQVYFFDQKAFSIVVVGVVANFHTFINHCANFIQTWHDVSCMNGIQVCSNGFSFP